MAEDKTILFILSGNISTTPRARKVLELLEMQGEKVELIMFNRGERWKELDEKYLKAHTCRYRYLPFLRKEKPIIWLSSTFWQKIASNMRYGIGSCAVASSKVNAVFKLTARLSGNYRAIYGFSSMLYPAYWLARRLGVPFAFDMEDYHPLENIYHKDKEAEIKRRERMFVELLPKASFVTYASPLIKAKTEELLAANGVHVDVGEVVNNTFNVSDFKYVECKECKVQFVWFSQTVSFERGLEQILPALRQYADKVHLTIIGNLDERFYEDVLKPYNDILTLKPAMNQADLHLELCSYDVGLAIEQTIQANDNGNKELCLSNKIFSYLLAGLYIFATDTPAQKEFMETHKDHGLISGQSSADMTLTVEKIINSFHEIRENKHSRFIDAQKFGWENESEKLKSLLAMV